MAVLVRLARAADGEAIAAIYRPYVEGSRISFEEEAPDGTEIIRRMSDPIYPWLVESGIYLAPEAQGRGIGRALLTAHLALLERQGFVTVIAGIALPNE